MTTPTGCPSCGKLTYTKILDDDKKEVGLECRSCKHRYLRPGAQATTTAVLGALVAGSNVTIEEVSSVPDYTLQLVLPGNRPVTGNVSSNASLADAMVELEVSGDAYIENKGEPLDKNKSLAALGISGNTKVYLR